MVAQLTAAEIAAFAVDVFDDATDIARRLPPGFVRLLDIPGATGEGFVGAAYFNAATGQLVVACRGSEALASAFTELSFVAGDAGAFSQAEAFAEAARAAAEAIAGAPIAAANVAFTGHGSGGGLAALAAAATPVARR